VKFNLEMPVGPGADDPQSVVAIARAAEAAGFHAIAYTDHPAPSRKWLQNGGHQTLDPFAALSFCAAVTTRIRLMTYLTVLPYRNPLLLLKSVATVDRLSGGRLSVAVGSGYLRSEFAALGRPFEDRNALTDEALEVLTSGFDPDGLTFQGQDFVAVDQVCSPGPVQLPHPPIWVGGNSRRSRERAARYGQGWAPLFATDELAGTVRTAPLKTLDALARRVGELRALASAAGRDPAQLGVQVNGLGDLSSATAASPATSERIDALRECGVTEVILRPSPDASVEETEHQLAAFGRAVIHL
jgi:probable F420-dependent oxidoreductase